MSVPCALEGDERAEKRAIIPVRFDITVMKGAARADVRLTFVNAAKDHRIRLRVGVDVSRHSPMQARCLEPAAFQYQFSDELLENRISHVCQNIRI